MTLVFLSLGTVQVHADTLPDSCDAEIYSDMKSFASLEAQRDLSAAGRYISRGKSVLALSCFTESGAVCETMASIWHASKCNNFNKADFGGLNAFIRDFSVFCSGDL